MTEEQCKKCFQKIDREWIETVGLDLDEGTCPLTEWSNFCKVAQKKLIPRGKIHIM